MLNMKADRTVKLWLLILCFAVIFLTLPDSRGNAGQTNETSGKIILQGTILYSDGTPTSNKLFILGELYPSGEFLLPYKNMGDNKYTWFASAMTDEKGFLRMEIDKSGLGDSKNFYTLVSSPQNNNKLTPCAIERDGKIFYMKLTGDRESFDLDQFGRIIYPLPKEFDSTEKIPPLDAVVDNLNFYETDGNDLPKDQRRYNHEFSAANTRYIYWELTLNHPAPGKKTDFVLTAIWKKPNGSILTTQNINCHADATWTSSYYDWGWGYKTAGKWEKGMYVLEIYIDGKPAAFDSFTVH
jgi:hypothetical protein